MGLHYCLCEAAIRAFASVGNRKGPLASRAGGDLSRAGCLVSFVSYISRRA